MTRSWSDLDVGATTRQRPKRRKKADVDTRVRWKMSIEELCYAAGIDSDTFTEWVHFGLVGKSRDLRVTREVAQKTVLVARLVGAGLYPTGAGCVAAGHKTGDTSPLVAELPGGVTVTVLRTDLP